jgi:lysophospholipid acyltransferase (LPLAT)-like uncharacterized protein
MKKQIDHSFNSKAINFLASFLEKTWRYSETGITEYTPSNSQNVIYCTWHENILPLSYYYKKLYLKKQVKFSAVISESRDGRLLASILEKWGMTIISGSSSKKGLSALRSAAREVKEGCNLIITPDGPRGPRRVVKDGIALVSILSEVPVIPVSLFPKKMWRLKSWDRFVIPKPFTKIEVRFGAPIYPNEEGSSTEIVSVLVDDIQRALLPHKEEENR